MAAAGVDRAELLSAKIMDLLDRSGLQLCQLSRILVSVGPGSYTGLRIGLATALGLSDSSATELIGVSALEAIYLESRQPAAISVVPLGKNDVCWQLYSGTDVQTEPESGTPEEFSVFASKHSDIPIAAHSQLLEMAREDKSEFGDRLIDVGVNIAEIIFNNIGRLHLFDPQTPLYVASKRQRSLIPQS